MNDPACNANAETFALYYSKPVGVLALVLAIGLTLTYFPSLVALSFQKGLGVVIAPFLLIVVPVLFLLYRFSLRALLHTDPVVIFSTEGVTDLRQQNSFAAWDDIGMITLGVGETAHYLCFGFRSADIARQYLRRAFWLRTLFLRARSQSDWNLNLLPLRCSRLEVLRIAKAFHQRAVRKQVIHVNREGARDLFVNDQSE